MSNKEYKIVVHEIDYANLFLFDWYLKNKADRKKFDITIEREVQWTDDLPKTDPTANLNIVFGNKKQMDNWARYTVIHRIKLFDYEHKIFYQGSTNTNPTSIVIRTNILPEAKKLRRYILEALLNNQSLTITKGTKIAVNKLQDITIEVIDDPLSCEESSQHQNNEELIIHFYGTPYCDLLEGRLEGLNQIKSIEKEGDKKFDFMTPTYLGIMPDSQGMQVEYITLIKDMIEKIKCWHSNIEEEEIVKCFNAKYCKCSSKEETLIKEVLEHNKGIVTPSTTITIKWDDLW